LLLIQGNVAGDLAAEIVFDELLPAESHCAMPTTSVSNGTYALISDSPDAAVQLRRIGILMKLGMPSVTALKPMLHFDSFITARGLPQWFFYLL